MKLVTFASGSTGNCALASDNGCHVLIDAGISMRRIQYALAAQGLTMGDISGVLITHDHSDHISGLATMMKKHRVPIYAPQTVAHHLCWTVVGIEENLRELPLMEKVRVGGFSVTAFPTPHDTQQSVGYRIEGSATLGFATDMGCVTDDILSGLTSSDAVLIEANHDPELLRHGKYPYFLKKRILSDNGHLSNDDCGKLAAYLAGHGTRYIVLGHLSRDNNAPALAQQAVSAALEQAGLAPELYVAPATDALTVEFSGAAAHSGSKGA